MFFQFIAFSYLLCDNGEIQRITESLSTTGIRTSNYHYRVVFRNYEASLIWLRQSIHLQTSR